MNLGCSHKELGARPKNTECDRKLDSEWLGNDKNSQRYTFRIAEKHIHMLSYITNWLEKVWVGFSRTASYVLYLVPFRLQKFQRQHPHVRILVSGVTKARKMEASSPVQRELGWVTSRRGMLILTETSLLCGNWTIPLETIGEATLLDLTGGYVLKITTLEEVHYQFGLNKNIAWETQSVLPLTKQKGNLGYSTQSLVLRAIVLISLIWYLYQGITTSNLVQILLALVCAALIGIPLIVRILQKLEL
mgnify:CR=1 FL=1